MKQILVVDDNPLTLACFDEAIRHLRCNPVPAANGKQAIELAMTQMFALMLIDANMPELDGAATLAVVRQKGSPNQDTVAVLTSADSSIQNSHAQSLGFSGVLYKPFTSAELLAILSRFAGHAAGDLNSTPALDEEQSRLSSGGDSAIAAALRTLFIKELEELPDELEQYKCNMDFRALRDRLHRLDASAGICGTPQLAEANRVLRSQLDAELEWPAVGIREFLTSCERTRVALNHRLSEGRIDY